MVLAFFTLARFGAADDLGREAEGFAPGDNQP